MHFHDSAHEPSVYGDELEPEQRGEKAEKIQMT